MRAEQPAVVTLAGGDGHSLALKNDGSVWAWGSNRYGKLGNGSSSASASVQTRVANLTNATAIAAGENHNLASTVDGSVWAWGSNQYGQLSLPSNIYHEKSAPVQIAGLSHVVMVAAGANHSLALKNDGTVWAWGANQSGQLGSAVSSSNTPLQVPGLTDVMAIAAGRYHSVALKRDGTVWSWGLNQKGQIGSILAGAQCPYPVRADNLAGVTSIAAGGDQTMALTSDRSVWRWGEAVGRAPQQVSLSLVFAIAAGAHHCLALRIDGSVWAWGDNSDGQLGHGDNVTSQTPSRVDSLPFSLAIGAGARHSLARSEDGAAWSWGSNVLGELGIGFAGSSANPVAVTLTSIAQLAAGGSHSLARAEDGSVWSWGDNSLGQLGTGSPAALAVRPQRIGTFTMAKDVAAGEAHSLMVAYDATVRAWGDNSNGQLGDGTVVQKTVPVPVEGLTGITAVAAGSSHSLALRADGTVYAWGSNYAGQLGLGYPDRETRPIQVPGLAGVKAIAAGSGHSVALMLDGRVWTWGDNDAGQLGDGTRLSRPAPMPVGLSDVKAVAAGGEYSLALRADGTVWGWGNARVGASVGLLPQQILGLTDVLAIAAGEDHSLAITSDRRIWAWGCNGYGQLGTGAVADVTWEPVLHPVLVGLSRAESAVAIAAGSRHSLAAVYTDMTPPSVQVANSEWLYTGTPYTIRWSASDDTSIESFTVWFTAGGGYYTRIDECSDLAGTARSCVWRAPGPVTSAGGFWITALDRAGNVGECRAGTPVTVTAGTPSITLLAPAAGSVWGIGSTQQIRWASNLSLTSVVKIEFSPDGGLTWSLVVGAVNRGFYDWTVPRPAAAQARLRLSWTNAPSVVVTGAAFSTVYVFERALP